jgi:hypothetical protein
MEIGDAVSGLPGGCGGHGGGREQHAGKGMVGADRGGGPGGALLCCPGRLYEVRHHSPRAWQASHVQAVAGAGCAAVTPNQPPHFEHWLPLPVAAGAGAAAEEGGQLLGSQFQRPHSGHASSAITGRYRVSTG